MLNAVVTDTFNFDNIDPDNMYYSDFSYMTDESSQSNYFSTIQYNNLNKISKLNIITYNIRSFSANSDCFLALFSEFNNYPDILVLTETWFTSVHKCEIPSYTSYHTIRENGRSGGVSIYIHNSITSNIIPNYCFAIISIMT